MNTLAKVLNELSAQQQGVQDADIRRLIALIQQARHIFLAGAGRSGLMINAFANRLMHLGFSVSVVGEISSPHSQAGDLMIVGSGSGETQRLVNQAQIARENEVTLALITGAPDSTLGRMAECTLTIPASDNSQQPMGTLFEQTSLLVYDSIALALMQELGETSQSMKQRHADIE